MMATQDTFESGKSCEAGEVTWSPVSWSGLPPVGAAATPENSMEGNDLIGFGRSKATPVVLGSGSETQVLLAAQAVVGGTMQRKS